MASTKNLSRISRQNPSRFYSPLDRFFRNDLFDFWDTNMETVPSINLTDEKDKFKVEMAAPGLKKEDFNIEVEGNVLTISCEKESETNDGDGAGRSGSRESSSPGYTRREYNYSSFSRSFTLPDFADTSRIAAKYTDGILNLIIPKKEESLKSKNQKITVE